MPASIVCPSGIYAITNTVNGKKYIGSAVNFQRRWWKHTEELKLNRHHSIKLQNSWNKHGSDSFEFSVLEYVESLSLLIEREQVYLDAIDASKSGYNICPNAGSRIGSVTSEETKRKLSEALKGRKRKPHSDESREKMRQGMLGKKPSKETIAKVVAANTGRKHPSEFGAAISIRKKGVKFSDEHKAKLSAWQKGTTQSDETRAKRSASLKGRPRDPDVMSRILETRAKNRAAKLAVESNQ